MPNLRSHCKDTAIGGLTQQNLERVVDILNSYASRLEHPVWKWFYSDRKYAVEIGLIAAAFSRVKGIPEPLPAQFDAQVKLGMENGQ